MWLPHVKESTRQPVRPLPASKSLCSQEGAAYDHDAFWTTCPGMSHCTTRPLQVRPRCELICPMPRFPQHQTEFITMPNPSCSSAFLTPRSSTTAQLATQDPHGVLDASPQSSLTCCHVLSVPTIITQHSLLFQETPP